MDIEEKRWLSLAILVVAQFMIVLDVSIVNVALPSIQRSLGLTQTDLQWMVSAYTLAFGGFLLLGGRAADLYGRRRIFIAGAAGFTLVSLLIGITESAALIVPLRALQGLCAAFMSPAALSIILTLFREGRERARALSVWGAVSAGGATAGLLLGGILTEYLGWRWDFFVNVPIGIGVCIASLILLPSHAAEERTKSLDLPGAVFVTSGLMLLVFALTRGHGWGWMSFTTLGTLGASIVLLALFIWNESRARHPLMPLSVFKIGNIGAANLTQMPITASLFAMFFFLSLYVQNVLHYSPLQTGLSFLPTSLLIGAVAILAPAVLRHVNFKWVLVAAPLFLATALFIFAHAAVGGTYFHILPGLLIMPLGLGLSFIALTIAATAGVPAHESGLASGLLNTAQQIGGALGLAILSTIASSTTSGAIASGMNAPQALVEGFHSAFYAGMFFALAASLSALFFIRAGRAPAQMAPEHRASH